MTECNTRWHTWSTARNLSWSSIYGLISTYFYSGVVPLPCHFISARQHYIRFYPLSQKSVRLFIKKCLITKNRKANYQVFHTSLSSVVLISSLKLNQVHYSQILVSIHDFAGVSHFLAPSVPSCRKVPLPSDHMKKPLQLSSFYKCHQMFLIANISLHQFSYLYVCGV